MKVVDLEQRTDDWQVWRRDGVSATSCAIIMGANPDKTKLQLWRELVGLDTPPDLSVIPQVRRGKKFEPIALQAFGDKYGQLGLPICAESDEYPFIRASFDGLLADGSPVEIKNLAETNHLQVLELREKSPAYQLYRWQVMHQMIVCGAQRGYLWFWSPKHEPLCLVVDRDDILFHRIVDDERSFWQMVEEGTPPAADPMRDNLPMEMCDEQAWKELAEKRRKIEVDILAAKARLKELNDISSDLESQLKGMMGQYLRADAYGVRITQYAVDGGTDWQALALDAMGDNIPAALLDKHQKEGRVSTRVTVDTNFQEQVNKPKPMPRVRKPAKADQEPLPMAAGFWF